MYPGRRTGTDSRSGGGANAHNSLVDLLEALRTEIETTQHDLQVAKVKNGDYEAKLQQLQTENAALQASLRDFQQMKLNYETEILGLRRQIETLGMVPVTAMDPRGLVNVFGLPTPPGLMQTPPVGPFPPPGVQAPSPAPGAITQSSKTTGKRSGGKMDIDSKAPTTAAVSAAAAGLTAFSQVPLKEEPTNGAPSDAWQALTAASALATPLPQAGAKRVKAEKSKRSGDSMDLVGRPGSPIQFEYPRVILPSTANDVYQDHGIDWVSGYNSNIQRRLDIGLRADLDHDSVVCAVKFSPNGRMLATGSNFVANIFDVETGRKLHSFVTPPPDTETTESFIRSVCFSPDCQYLVAAGEDKKVKVYDIEKKVLKHNIAGHELDIYSLDYSRDGRFIVSGSGDKKVKIWDAESGKCVYTLGSDEIGPKDGVTSVAFSPDGRLVAAASLDKIIRIWDAETGYFLDRFEGHAESVYSVAFDAEGKALASGSLDKTLKLWDLGTRARSRCRATFAGHQDFVLSVAFPPDGNWLVSASKDRFVHFWELRSTALHMMLQGHSNSVLSVSTCGSDDGAGRFASGSGDKRARIWNYRTSGPLI